MKIDTNYCEWVDERLETFLARELSDAEAKLLQTHLQHCGHCQRACVLAERIEAGLRSLPRLECPNSVIDHVGKKSQRRWPVWAAAAAIGALALGVSFTFNQPDPRPSRQELNQARAELRLAMGYIAAVGQLASRDVGRTITGNTLHPIAQGLKLQLNYPLIEVIHSEESQT